MGLVNISYYFLFQFQENWYLVQGIQRRSYRVCSLLLLKKWSEGRKCDSNIIYLQKGICCFSVGWMGWNQIFPGATANKYCLSFGRCRNSGKGQGFRGLASGTGSVQMSLVGWGRGFCWVAASLEGPEDLMSPEPVQMLLHRQRQSFLFLALQVRCFIHADGWICVAVRKQAFFFWG